MSNPQAERLDRRRIKHRDEPHPHSAYRSKPALSPSTTPTPSKTASRPIASSCPSL